ncbi:lysophospholipid acyltransferase family protein [Pedobacter hartonius]|uniref:KDO2-lipid IV(A) lauroyltransferase n=1 Tax=Pedobacter hartonius TaxID=425514 RepID=A0A1H3XBQ6_9SPHI|nr:lysophospholipid acyltransferase family protein [Pedobacter hartonius]SDZ96763.1 KDO2-lipid IV(A) lauroyltransferase [Pedobacter hartonius]
MVLLRGMAKLPLSVLYVISGIVAFFAYHVIRYRYKVIFTNLQQSFPEKDDREIRKLTRQFYLNLTDWLVETLRASEMSAGELEKRVRFVNTGVLDKHLEQGKSVITMATHQFNWEWMLLAGSLRFKVPVDAVYTPVSNKKVEEFILRTRSRFGGLPIPKDETLPVVAKRIKEQRIIGLVADQMPAKDNQHKYWTTFLNQDTAFFMGAESLPKITKLPVVFMAVHKVKRGYYEVKLEEIAQPPYNYQENQILPAYVQRAEQLIRANPDGWLWSHRRWKYQRGAYE